eukprot:753042-Hanusia_phi.AAC.1
MGRGAGNVHNQRAARIGERENEEGGEMEAIQSGRKCEDRLQSREILTVCKEPGIREERGEMMGKGEAEAGKEIVHVPVARWQ